MWCVYEHISPSGKVYVGITSNTKVRWSSNGYRYTTYNSIFKKAILKYGWNNFKHIIILDKVSKSEACYAERHLIRWYKMHKLSYNITDGGGGTLGRVCSEQTKEKLRASAKGPSLSTLNGIRRSNLHKIQAAKNLERAHEARRGSYHTDATKALIREKAVGRDMTKAQEASKLKTSRMAIVTFPDESVLTFPSISEAARYIGSNPANISRSLKTGGKTKNCKISYYDQ